MYSTGAVKKYARGYESVGCISEAFIGSYSYTIFVGNNDSFAIRSL